MKLDGSRICFKSLFIFFVSLIVGMTLAVPAGAQPAGYVVLIKHSPCPDDPNEWIMKVPAETSAQGWLSAGWHPWSVHNGSAEADAEIDAQIRTQFPQVCCKHWSVFVDYTTNDRVVVHNLNQKPFGYHLLKANVCYIEGLRETGHGGGGGDGSSCGLGTSWSEFEVDGWAGNWVRRGNTDVFDAVFSRAGETVTSVLSISMSGHQVSISRNDAPNRFGVTNCSYTGTASNGTVSGTYTCTRSDGYVHGPFEWSANIQCGTTSERLLETLRVSNTNPNAIQSSFQTRPGATYRIEAEGVISCWDGKTDGVDPVWCYAEWRCGNGAVWDHLRINGKGMTDWAGHEIPYNPGHIYEVRIQGDGNPIVLGCADALAGSYGDNAGEFTVRIYGPS